MFRNPKMADRLPGCKPSALLHVDTAELGELPEGRRHGLEQGDAVSADGLVVDHDHDVVEEAVDRRASSR